MCGTSKARAPDRGTGPKERVAGPRVMETLGPCPEYLILHYSWAQVFRPGAWAWGFWQTND
jgi:hypothetical protein